MSGAVEALPQNEWRKSDIEAMTIYGLIEKYRKEIEYFKGEVEHYSIMLEKAKEVLMQLEQKFPNQGSQ